MGSLAQDKPVPYAREPVCMDPLLPLGQYFARSRENQLIDIGPRLGSIYLQMIPRIKERIQLCSLSSVFHP